MPQEERQGEEEVHETGQLDRPETEGLRALVA